VKVIVGRLVREGVNVIDGVKVAEAVRDGVKVGVGVYVAVGVGVGEFVIVPVTIRGVRLKVGVGTVPVMVTVGVYVSVTVGVNWVGLGASARAIQPMQ